MQDSNYEASNQLSSLEREAKELTLSSESLNNQLDILKNSNFLGMHLDYTSAVVIIKTLLAVAYSGVHMAPVYNALSD